MHGSHAPGRTSRRSRRHRIVIVARPSSPIDHLGNQIRRNPNPNIAPKTLRMRSQKRASLPKQRRSSTLNNTGSPSHRRPRRRSSRRSRSPTSRALRNRTTSRSNINRKIHPRNKLHGHRPSSKRSRSQQPPRIMPPRNNPILTKRSTSDRPATRSRPRPRSRSRQDRLRTLNRSHLNLQTKATAHSRCSTSKQGSIA